MKLIRRYAEQAGAESAHKASHWMNGGTGAVELADAVMEFAAKKSNNFKFLYPSTCPSSKKSK